MNPGGFGSLDRLGGPLDVVSVGAGETGYGSALDALGDQLDRFEVTGRGRRKAGFDDVDAQLDQGVGHLELLLDRHRRAGRLLAVSQSGVEDPDSFPYIRLR